MYKKLIFEISNTQIKMIRYFVNLLDDRTILSTIKLLDLLIFLLPQWMGIDYSELRHGKIKGYKVQ